MAREHTSVVGSVAKYSLAFLVLFVVGYLCLCELERMPIDFSALTLSLNPYYLIIALITGVLSYLVEVVIWKMIINIQVGHKKITSQEIIAIIFASALFKYCPGRIWTFTAQSLWLEKYGITKSLTLYINMVCIVELIIISLYFGLAYIVMATNYLNLFTISQLLTVLLTANVLFVVYGNCLINKVFSFTEKFTSIKFTRLHISSYTMVAVQIIYTTSWGLLGLATYFLAKGFGLHIFLLDTVFIIASMSLAWLAGFLVTVAPAGLGVREGMMLLMLKPVLTVQTALLLPIMSRVLLVLSESFLGMIAVCLGVRRDVFLLKNNVGSE